MGGRTAGGTVAIVRRFRRLRALVVGDVMLDSYLEGTASRLCTEGPVPVVRKLAEERSPGGAANVAANLRALGAKVDLVGLVGVDPAAGLLRAALAERGVADAGLVADDRVETLHKLRILADHQYVVRFDEGETSGAGEAARADLMTRFEAAFEQCDVVVISDYRYGAVSDALLERLRALRAKRPVPLVVDSKDLLGFRSVRATVVTPNLLEARLAVDPAGRLDGQIDRSETEVIGRRLLAEIDAEQAAITMAGDGVLLVSRGDPSRHIPAHPVSRANDVGAGDTFTAALALALGAGAPVTTGVEIGVDAAGIAVTRRRTATVGHQELLQRASLRDETGEAGVTGEAGLTQVARALEATRLAGGTVVFTNGVFDILHAGHVRFLRAAKALGDVLVVGVNSDRSARSLPGERRPINGERDRLALVAALDAVDHAVLFDEADPAAIIRSLRPDIHAKGGDYADEPLPESAAVAEVGGRVVILPLAGGPSADEVVERILAQALGSGAGTRR